MPCNVAASVATTAASQASLGGGHAAAAMRALVGFSVSGGLGGAGDFFLGASLFGFGGALVLPLASSIPVILLTSLERGH